LVNFFKLFKIAIDKSYLRFQLLAVTKKFFKNQIQDEIQKQNQAGFQAQNQRQNLVKSIVEKPLISIVIPHFQDKFFQKHYLVDCLKSVKGQTFVNYECIVVMDGFFAESERIFFETVGDDSRFFLIKQTHAGLPTTRLNGFKHASGKWTISLDSDDYFVNLQVLEKINLAIKEVEDLGEIGILAGLKKVSVYEEPTTWTTESWLVYLQYSITQCCVPTAWLVSKNCDLRIKFDFDVSVLMLALIEQKAKIFMLKNPLVYYRQRVGSLNHIKETKDPDIEIRQAVASYRLFLKSNSISFRQKILCYLGIIRYKFTPPKSAFQRLFRAFFTFLAKIISGSNYKIYS